ncbi:unnamed protein product [Caenorhabditis brenneri]
MCRAKSLKVDFTPQASESTESRIINGASLQKWTKHPETSTINIISRNFDENILQVFKHFQELFLVKGYQYELTGFTRSFLEHTMQRVPKTVDTLTIGDWNQDEEAVFQVLDNLTVTSQLMLDVDITRVHEKMKNLDFLMIRHFNGNTEELATLNSKNLNIWFINDFSNTILHTILRHWKQSKTQLKSFKIVRPPDHETPNLMTMLDGLDPKHWDYQRRSAFFMMGNEEIDCSQYKDIERDCDGLLGSLGWLFTCQRKTEGDDGFDVDSLIGLKRTPAKTDAVKWDTVERILENSFAVDPASIEGRHHSYRPLLLPSDLFALLLQGQNSFLLSQTPLLPSCKLFLMLQTFRLLNLPGKAFKTVFKYYDVPEVFFFSTLSNRAKRLVKSLKRRALYIEIHFYSGCEIDFPHHVIRFGKNKQEQCDIESMTPCELEITDLWDRTSIYFTLPGFGVKEWFEHFSFIFNQPFVNVNFCYRDRWKYTLESVCKLLKGFYIGELVVRDHPCEVLRQFPVMRSLNMDIDDWEQELQGGDLNFIKKVLLGNISFIRIFRAIPIDLDILLMMNSPNISTDYSLLSDKELNTFIKLWLKGANRNLEGLSLNYYYRKHLRGIERTFDECVIFKGVKYEVLNDERSFRSEPGYLIRKSDGTMASVYFKFPKFDLKIRD